APAGRALSLDSSDRSDLGVGGLLVAVIEIVHRLLERQAIHRMERGSLTSEQIERLGQALMALDQRVNQLIEIFNPHSAPASPVTVAGAAH
ncbi:MAG TPA: gas vesicle protein K, partial [Jatrophihabitans sp.]|nr:gas vesicle protein K [Jatrophihabitans sp.]